MRKTFLRFVAGLAVALVLGCGVNALAGHVRVHPARVHHVRVHPARIRYSVKGTPAAADLLRQAYAILASADHDYKSHRLAAMHSIEAAGRELGFDVHGDGKAHEAQPLSDKQLSTAQGLLEQARAGLAGKPLQHINHAIKQLSTALKIK